MEKMASIETMFKVLELLRTAFAITMRFMFAVHLCSEVAWKHSGPATRELTTTVATLWPSNSFMSFVKGSHSALVVQVQTSLATDLNIFLLPYFE
jgi:hypothetical protein